MKKYNGLQVTSIYTLAILFVAGNILGGCGGGVQIAEKSPGSGSFSGLEHDIKRLKPLGIFKSIRYEMDGVEVIPSNPFLITIRGKFRETNLFHEVLFEKPFGMYPYVEMEVTLKNSQTNNSSLNAAKSMAGGVTLGLLAIFFPLEGTYSGEMQVKAFRSDGLQKEYQAKSSGTAQAYLSLQNFGFVWDKLIRTVDGNNFNSVLSQMVEDSEFFKVETEVEQNLSGPTPTL